MLPDYTPIPDEVKELSIVKDVEDIANTIADMVSGSIKYKADKQKLEKFDVKGVDDAFESMLAL